MIQAKVNWLKLLKLNNLEPGRVFGASHVPLSTDDEEKRRAQIADIKSLTEETNRNRLKQKSKIILQKELTLKRVNRLREQKGLPLLTLSDDEKETNEDTQLVRNFEVLKL